MQSLHFAKRGISLVLMMLSLCAIGCVRTTHPVLKDEQVMSNDGVLGKWVSSDGKVQADVRKGDDLAGENHTGENHTGENHTGENHSYKLLYTNEDGKKSNLLIRFGKVGELTVGEVSADAFSTETAGEYRALLTPMYMMVVIQKQSASSVVLTAPSVDWFKKYVLAHPDELDVSNPDDMIVDLTTDDFQAFIIRHAKDNGMLGDPATFVRPGDPTTQPAK